MDVRSRSVLLLQTSWFSKLPRTRTPTVFTVLRCTRLRSSAVPSSKSTARQRRLLRQLLRRPQLPHSLPPPLSRYVQPWLYCPKMCLLVFLDPQNMAADTCHPILDHRRYLCREHQLCKPHSDYYHHLDSVHKYNHLHYHNHDHHDHSPSDYRGSYPDRVCPVPGRQCYQTGKWRSICLRCQLEWNILRCNGLRPNRPRCLLRSMRPARLLCRLQMGS